MKRRYHTRYRRGFRKHVARNITHWVHLFVQERAISTGTTKGRGTQLITLNSDAAGNLTNGYSFAQSGKLLRVRGSLYAEQVQINTLLYGMVVQPDMIDMLETSASDTRDTWPVRRGPLAPMFVVHCPAVGSVVSTTAVGTFDINVDSKSKRKFMEGAAFLLYATYLNPDTTSRSINVTGSLSLLVEHAE